MISILSYVDHLFQKADQLEKRGLTAEACRTYTALLRVRPMERQQFGEAAGRLGKLELELGRFARARRHLTQAVARICDNAEYQNLLARAIEADGAGDAELAERHFRHSVQLQPTNPAYLIDLAGHVGDQGKREEAVELLRQAMTLSQDDSEMVGRIAEELRNLEQTDEAADVMRLVQFRHGRDARFGQLRREHQFQTLWARQQSARKKAPSSRAEETPILRIG